MTKKAQKTNSGTMLLDSHWDGAVLKSSKTLRVGVNYVLLSHLTMSVYFMMHHCAKHYMENMIKYSLNSELICIRNKSTKNLQLIHLQLPIQVTL